MVAVTCPAPAVTIRHETGGARDEQGYRYSLLRAACRVYDSDGEGSR